MTIKRAIFGVLIGLTLLSLPVQWIVDPSPDNVAATCLVMASSIGVLLYVGMSRALVTQPLSTFAVLGFCVTTHMAALLIQSVALTPLRSYLYSPLYTFGAIVMYQWLAIAAHAAYRYFSVFKSGGSHLVRGMLQWMGFYEIPSAEALWFMGLFGMASFYPARYEGVIGKIGFAFTFLAWSPFLIPFYQRDFDDKFGNAGRNKILLIMYSGAIGLLGLALNARQIIFIGVLTVGLLYLLSGMKSSEPVTRAHITRIAALGLLALVFAAPLSDLATSMAIAREWRGKVSPITMIKTTYRVWKRPELLAAYRAESDAVSRFRAYDERYIANPGLARLVSTKFIDNSLHFGDALKSEDSKDRLWQESIHATEAVLPAPALAALGIDLDKEAMQYSMGDYLAYLSRGLPLGGHKTGSMLAQGQVLFGPLFAVFFFVICLLLYGLMDLLTVHTSKGVASLSALGMLEIWRFFNQGIHYEGLHDVVSFYVRNFETMLLIYLMVFSMAKLVSRSTHALFGRPTVDQLLRSA